MKNLYKNCMTAIERDYFDPEYRGKAHINLKHVPNGHYTVFYLRIGQPISINSRLKVLGMASSIYININRKKLSKDKKPQLDFNPSSSRISRHEKSMFKKIKAKQQKLRDNKVLQLNSDNEDEEVEENPLDLAKSFRQQSPNSRRHKKETPGDPFEMEFEQSAKPAPL